ncbi:MAG: RNA polymerase sigma factor [Myxococcota bacterium]
MTGSDDWALLRAWRGGDSAAGGILFERYAATVIRFFRSKTDTDVDDLVQDTFFACSRGDRAIEGHRAFRSYLLGVARHKLYDSLSRRGREPFDPMTQSATDLGASPFSEIARAQESQLVLRALRAVPLDFQVTLELFYWDELSGEEIAEVTGVSPHTVRSRLARGRERLKMEIERLTRRELRAEDLERITRSASLELSVS